MVTNSLSLTLPCRSPEAHLQGLGGASDLKTGEALAEVQLGELKISRDALEELMSHWLQELQTLLESTLRDGARAKILTVGT